MYSGEIFGKDNLYTTKNSTLTPTLPFLACFCETRNETIWHILWSSPENYTFTMEDGTQHHGQICEDFRTAKMEVFSFRYMAILILILTAHKLRLVVEHTVAKMGTDNGAGSGSYVIFTVFLCQMFNYDVLLLTANSNMES